MMPALARSPARAEQPAGPVRIGRWLAGLQGWRAGLAAALFGALSAAALPPLDLVPVLLIAIPGLLTLLGGARSRRSAFALGFWFAFAQNLFGLYWITEAILIEAARYWWFVPIAVPGLSAVLALFVGAACLVASFAAPGWRRILVLAGAWVLGDFARQFIATGFPWNLLGSVWEFPGYAGDVFIQPAAWVSVHGLTIATLVLAGLPTLGRRGWLAAASGLVLWAGAGAWRLSWPASPPPGLTVMLVQGNVAEGMKWNRAAAMAVFRRYLALTADAVAAAPPGPHVVVWPETASPFLLQRDAPAREAIARAANGGITTGPTPALVGSVRFVDGHPRNSLLALDGAGHLVATYDKWHLVPGGEFAPGWVPFAVQIVPGGGFKPGSGPKTLDIAGIPPVGPLICYEAIYPGEMVDEKHRPDWLVNITNDAWFGNSSGPRQHLAAVRLRAVEEGLPIMRAANTGISVVFDAHGHEISRLGMRRTAVLTASLPGRLPQTLFARAGLALPAALAILAVASGLLLPRRRSRVARG